MTTQAFRFINFGVVGFVVCWITLFIFWEGTASRLVREDGVVEWLQFLFLVATAVCCYLIARGYRRYYNSPLVRGGFLLFSLLSILLAAEEISWGQRLLSIETPEFLVEINTQDEKGGRKAMQKALETHYETGFFHDKSAGPSSD